MQKTNGKKPSQRLPQSSDPPDQQMTPIPQPQLPVQMSQEQMLANMQQMQQMLQMTAISVPQQLMQMAAQSFDLTKVAGHMKDMFPAESAGSFTVKRTIEIIEEGLQQENEELGQKLRQKEDQVKQDLTKRNADLVGTIIFLSILGVIAIVVLAAIAAN
jgi:hypothetical protein